MVAKESGFKVGVAQAIYVVIGTVIGGVILAGLTAAYFSNLLPWVLLGIGLFIVFVGGPIIYVRWFRSKSKTLPQKPTLRRTPDTLQSIDKWLQRRTPIDSRPKKRLRHVVTVSLDTEVNPFDYRSERFEEGDEIEVEAESEEGASFHFMACDDDALRINERRTVNFVYYEGKTYTTRFKKRFEIPESGMWHFIAYTPEGEEYTTVTLTISKVE